MLVARKDRWKWLQTQTQPLLPKVQVLWLDLNIVDWCNGSTEAFDSSGVGSSPASTAIIIIIYTKEKAHGRTQD